MKGASPPGVSSVRIQDGRDHILPYTKSPTCHLFRALNSESISQYHESLPEGGPSQKFIDFDTRFYQRVQVFEKPGRQMSAGIGRVIKSTAIQPGSGMDDQFNRWYAEEHLEQVSQMPGWGRSTRFELIFKVQSKDDPKQESAPKYLAIHEFEEGTKVQRMRKEDWTEMTKKIVDSAVSVDEGTFEYLWGYGDADARL